MGALRQVSRENGGGGNYYSTSQDGKEWRQTESISWSAHFQKTRAFFKGRVGSILVEKSQGSMVSVPERLVSWLVGSCKPASQRLQVGLSPSADLGINHLDLGYVERAK